MAKVKVYNKNKFDVGIKLINPIKEQYVKGGSFTVIDEDDVYYLDSISTRFKRGFLVVENNDVAESINCVEIKEAVKTQEEYIAILKSNFTKMRSDLLKITEPHLKDAVYFAAVSISDDLSGAKIKFINDYCGKSLTMNNED